MSAHQRWLEAPYELAERNAVEYERFCERNDLDQDDPEAEERYEAWVDAMADGPD